MSEKEHASILFHTTVTVYLEYQHKDIFINVRTQEFYSIYTLLTKPYLMMKASTNPEISQHREDTNGDMDYKG